MATTLFFSSSSSSLVLQPLKSPELPKQWKSRTLTVIVNSNSQSNSKPSMNSQKPNSRNRRKSSYGSSRRSALKKTFVQEQVMFTARVSSDPHVGIIGGGMAGLLCALSLEKRGVKSTVFDTVGDFYLVIYSLILKEKKRKK